MAIHFIVTASICSVGEGNILGQDQGYCTPPPPQDQDLICCALGATPLAVTREDSPVLH